MKIARFSSQNDLRYGILDEDEQELIVLTGDPMYAGYDTTGERVAVADAKLLAPVIPRSKVVGVARNHPATLAGKPAPERPQFFLKPNTSVIGPGDPIRLPANVGRVVYEGELAIVIGALARDVTPERAAEVIFGYTIANDVTAWDQLLAEGPWGRAKTYDSFCPIGPIIETEFEPSDATVRTWIGGGSAGETAFSEMLAGVPELVASLSEVFTLLPGDLILTGASPSTMGDITAGDTVSIEIDGIGALVNPVVSR